MTARLYELARSAFACAALLSAVACEGSQDREPLPDWSKGYPDAGADLASDPLREAFAFVIPSSLEYKARLGQRAALNQPCAITRSDAPAELECIADVNELDLWVLGFQYDIRVPAGMCDFVLHAPYMFVNYEIGRGPTDVAYTVHMDGTFSNEMNAMNGKPFCEFDHSVANKNAPNCCFGSYVVTITSAETGSKTTMLGDWGGKLGECYYGAAYVEEGAKLDADGVPMPRFIYTHREDHVEHTVYAGVSDQYPANVALASYWQDRDHGGAMPPALAAPGARPYYDAYCLDDAEEIIAHLRMSVREWNEEAEYDTKQNPDTEGEEPDFDKGPRNIDDVPDWKALTKVPGHYPYPSFPIAK